jgi:hypothetical protein
LYLHSRGIDRIRSIKHGDTELSFGKELNEAREIAEHAGVTILRPSSSFSAQLLQLASNSPTAAIIEGWKSLESSLKALAERAGVQWQSLPKTISTMGKAGYISADLNKILRYLLSLRDKAVHEPSTAITEGEAIEFLMLARSIAERVQQVDVSGGVRKS